MKQNNNKPIYRFYNRNDKAQLTGDCVCRAISTAVRLKYSAVQKLLTLTALIFECDRLCVCCYLNLLEKVLGYTPTFCDNGETVGDIARVYPNSRVIIRVDGHLTTSINGTVYDIFDCTREMVDCYWIVEY